MSDHPTTEIEINVSGMDCPSCAEKIEKVVSNMEAVESAAVNFTGGKMTVRYDEAKTNLERIEQQLRKLGYETRTSADEITDVFFIEGLDCPDESSVIEKKIGALAGVSNIAFNLVSGEATVSYDARVVTRAQIIDAIASTGMHAKMVEGNVAREESRGTIIIVRGWGTVVGSGMSMRTCSSAPASTTSRRGSPVDPNSRAR